jgi:hypothetical protein
MMGLMLRIRIVRELMVRAMMTGMVMIRARLDRELVIAGLVVRIGYGRASGVP